MALPHRDTELMGSVGNPRGGVAEATRITYGRWQAEEPTVRSTRVEAPPRSSVQRPAALQVCSLLGLRRSRLSGLSRMAARRTTMTRRLSVLVAFGLLLAGCGSANRPAADPAGDIAFQDRAAEVAAAWQERGIAAAWTQGFVPLQDLVVEPDWSPDGVLKASFGNGWIHTSSPLPDLGGRGVIRFADGTTLSVALVGAKAAYDQLPQRAGDCPTDGQPPRCHWLTITQAQLSTASIETSRGPAEVPAWSFTVDGLPRPLLVVAVAPSSTTTLPLEGSGLDHPDGIVSAMQLEPSRGSHSVAFDIGTGACDKGAQGLVSEFPELIVVGGTVAPPEAGAPCDDQLVLQRVEVRTTGPVGTRPIVDALTGRPVLARPATPSLPPSTPATG